MNIYIGSSVVHRLWRERELDDPVCRLNIRGRESAMTADGSSLLVVATVTNALVFLVTILLGLSAQPYLHLSLIPDLFERGINNVSDSFSLDITPADGTYAIWVVIFAWYLCWIVYTLTALCRKTGDGPVFVNPLLLPPAFYVFSIFSLGLTIAWMFLWDRVFLSMSLITMIAIAVLLYLALMVSYRALERNVPLLQVQGRAFEIWSVRIFIHNGVALFATWAVFECLLNLAVVLTYMSEKPVAGEIASRISLGILGGFILIYSFTDYFPFDPYSRFTVTPYAVFIIGLSGMFAVNPSATDINPIFIVVLLALSGIMALTKMFFICMRQITKPVEAEETTVFLRELDESRHLLK